MLNFLYPLIWPFANLYVMISGASKPVKNSTSGSFTLFEHLVASASSLRSAMFAYVCMFVLYDGFDYPAFGKGNFESTTHWNSGNEIVSG